MTMRTRATHFGFAIWLIAVLSLACALARAEGVIDPMEYGLQSLPPAMPVNPDVQPRDLIDALAVEMRTGKARGADTLSEVRLGVCGLSLRLKPAGAAFPRGETMRMVFAPDDWAPGSGATYPALPYGFLKNCDITLQHGSSLPEPGWHALNVRIFYHMQDQGWLWREPHNGWFRYQSAVHHYDGDNWWQAEYETPYDTSAEKYLQYFGTRAGGNLWLSVVFNKCPGCDLTAVNLREAFLEDGDFAQADFSYADLTMARLAGANLSGATFRKATLNQVVLDGQNLSGTDMSEAVVHDASLHGANLSGANLSGLDAHNSDFSEANLAGALLDNAAFVYCDFEKANLENSQMRSPDKPQRRAARLFGSYMQGATLRNAVLLGAGLDNTDLRGADLSGAIVDKLLILHNIKTNEKTICPDAEPGPCKW
jgi:uncharacterized protein YjbI with pentapeptide repeats